MQRILKILALISAMIFLAALAHGATITGTVKGPDGAPFKGAFVSGAEHQDQNYRQRAVSQGRQLSSRGFAGRRICRADSRRWVSGRPAHGRHADGESIRVHGLGAEAGDGALARSFALSRRKVDPEHSRQGDGLRSHVQFSRRALPNLPRFSNAHGFRVSRDLEGAKDRVDYMRTRMHYLLGSMVNDEQADKVASFIADCIRPGLRVAEISRGFAGIQEPGAHV